MTTIFGYDPGGNGGHGAACIRTHAGRVAEVEAATLQTAESVLTWIEARLPRDQSSIVGLGVDTLTLWSTGLSAYRPADRLLRAAYPEIRNSVVAPNSLYGSMPLNGVACVLGLRALCPTLRVTETHPKVLYYAMTGSKYDYAAASETMASALNGWLGAECQCRFQSEHEWDATISALAAREWLAGTWTVDLHAAPAAPGERLTSPVGASCFVWPAEPREAARDVASTSRRPAGSATSWQKAVDALREADHADAARALEEYENCLGQKGGWDSWFKRTYPELLPILED